MNTTPLNRATIEAMPAGAALNALIAIHVMGWQVIQEWPAHWNNRLTRPRTGPWYLPPDEPLAESKHGWQPDDFSTDIAAAWQVVEKMREHGYYSQHTDLTLDSEIEWWAWHFYSHKSSVPRSANGLTAPVAICRAALIAMLC